MTHSAALAYREASVQQASPVGLVIMLYDAMIRDLQKAIVAMKAGDIVGRCNHLKHGFMVLQQLEGLVDMKNGGQTAINLRRFYGHVRKQMLAAQFKLSPAILEHQISLFLEVREAWEQINTKGQPVQTAARPSEAQPQDTAPSGFSCSM